MAHFAQLNETNKVVRVLVVNNENLIDSTGNETEQKGIEFLQSLFGHETRWVQTSYNGNFRKRYAGIDFTYDSVRDAFVPRQPFPSWVLDESTCNWVAPIPYPDDDKFYTWDEADQLWKEIEIEIES
jgi:hypothetical protein